MTRKVKVQVLEEAGVRLGQISDPADFLDAQKYSQDDLAAHARDLLLAGATAPLVAGFGISLTSGLGFNIAAGHAYTPAGLHHETLPPGQASALALGAAHPSLPRIDLVYGLLEAETDAEVEFRPFRRLLTEAEWLAGIDPFSFPLESRNVATERHTRVTIFVRQGTPDANPVAPAANANEVALYQIRVNANAASLVINNVTDVRLTARSLAAVLAQLDAIGETIDDRLNATLQVAANSGLTRSYDDPGNALTLGATAATGSVQGMMSAADKTKLDAATDLNTAAALARRDASGHLRVQEIKVDAGVRFMPDNSFRRSAFVREDFLSLIETHDPVSFSGAAIGVYETIKRTPASTNNGYTAQVEYDCYLDPADAQNISFKFEVYAIHSANVWDSDIQLYNATDGAQLAFLNYTWLEGGYAKRSGLFQIGGSGLKRLVVRARSNTATSGVTKIWRARLIINPSF